MVPNIISPEIVQSAIGGDPMAIDSLLKLAQPDIRRYANRYCSSQEDADDATQETLWQLYRRMSTIRVVVALPAWLMAVVRRECTRLTGRNHSRQLFEEFAIESKSDPELRMDVASAIESLPDRYREIVVLRDLQGMTVDSIAQELGLSREAVKGRLHRARELLREYLSS